MDSQIKGLGRIKPERLDPRNKNFPVKALLPEKLSKRTSRYWNDNPVFLDQGQTSMCVGYAWTHWVNDGPVKHKGNVLGNTHAQAMYYIAQDLDEFPGNDYEGSSTLGGVKAAQARGFVESYHWSFALQTTIDAVLELGPIVVGTDWYWDMFKPNKEGVIKVGGDIAGGHEWVINGVNLKTKMFRAKNSWGDEWADKGRFWISFADVEKLMHDRGEFCLPTEKK